VSEAARTIPNATARTTGGDAHHVRHRADGGPTAVSNLVLLCRRHHLAIHRGFVVRMRSGRPIFTRPDGTVLEDRAPPARAA
jgi:5-methylcytosine-specific restriction endonuclease McrA